MPRGRAALRGGDCTARRSSRGGGPTSGERATRKNWRFLMEMRQLKARFPAESAAAVAAHEVGRAGLGVGVAGIPAIAVLRADPRFPDTERTRRALRGHGAG